MISEPRLSTPTIDDLRLSFVAICVYMSLLILGSQLLFKLAETQPYSRVIGFGVTASLIAEVGLFLFYVRLYGVFDKKELMIKGYQWLVLGVSIVILFYFYALIADTYGISTKNQKFNTALSTPVRIFYIANMILLGPILEEITTRRYMLELFRGKWPTLLSITLVSLIFTLMHLDRTLSQYVYTFFFFCF